MLQNLGSPRWSYPDVVAFQGLKHLVAEIYLDCDLNHHCFGQCLLLVDYTCNQHISGSSHTGLDFLDSFISLECLENEQSTSRW